MEIIFITLSVLQSVGISLGVGSSTLAILNFFHAIADGKIDENERNFMGITYMVLRVAMGIILVTALLLAVIGYIEGGAFFTSYVAAQAILVSVIFINSALMTLRLMPSTFGPAIQASSWYALGFISALQVFGFNNFSLWLFVFAYSTFIFFAISFINAMMAYLKDLKENDKPQVTSQL
jgi:hypothetical protein